MNACECIIINTLNLSDLKRRRKIPMSNSKRLVVVSVKWYQCLLRIYEASEIKLFGWESGLFVLALVLFLPVAIGDDLVFASACLIQCLHLIQVHPGKRDKCRVDRPFSARPLANVFS